MKKNTLLAFIAFSLIAGSALVLHEIKKAKNDDLDNYYTMYDYISSEVSVAKESSGATIKLKSISPEISIFIKEVIYERTRKTLSSGKKICIRISKFTNIDDATDIKYQIKSADDIFQSEYLVSRCKHEL